MTANSNTTTSKYQIHLGILGSLMGVKSHAEGLGSCLNKILLMIQFQQAPVKNGRPNCGIWRTAA